MNHSAILKSFPVVHHSSVLTAHSSSQIKRNVPEKGVPILRTASSSLGKTSRRTLIGGCLLHSPHWMCDMFIQWTVDDTRRTFAGLWFLIFVVKKLTTASNRQRFCFMQTAGVPLTFWKWSNVCSASCRLFIHHLVMVARLVYVFICWSLAMRTWRIRGLTPMTSGCLEVRMLALNAVSRVREGFLSSLVSERERERAHLRPIWTHCN